jgi:3-polyprenyl-4-hydroxybenzoate decarboxylase
MSWKKRGYREFKEFGPMKREGGGLCLPSLSNNYTLDNRITVVVDEDIDPANTNQVIWALCTRTDPREDVEILKRCWSTRLDPMSYPDGARVLNSRMVIDACRPWERLDTFPAVVTPSAELKHKVMKKWTDLFPTR